MPSYETLDAVADAFNPAIGLLALLLCIVPMFRKQWRLAVRRIIAFGLLMLIVYGLRFADRALDPSNVAAVGYSTHAAFAIAGCAFNFVLLPRWRYMWPILLLLYLGLVLYQGYHSWTDLVLTAAVVGPLAVGVLRAACRDGTEPIEGGKTTNA